MSYLDVLLGGYKKIQNNGADIAAEPTLNIIGATSIVDDSANKRTSVTLGTGITQLSGDVTAGPGSGSVSATVTKVHGATVPAAGSLTLGNVLQVSGVSALSYGPVDLAGGSNYVTGVLPPANMDTRYLNGVRIYTLEEFGGSAGASSSTNDTAMLSALAAVLAAGFGEIWLGAGNYALKSGYLIPTRCRILGLGKFVTKVTTTDNAVMFIQNGDYISLSEFEGSGNSTGAGQDFFNSFNGATGFVGTFITNVLVRQFARYGLWIALTTGTDDAVGRIHGVNAYNCGTAAFRGQSEYTTWIDCTAYACGDGFQPVAGNQTWVGGELTLNAVGFHLINSGGNDAHGLLVGTKCNHNTVNVQADATANGYVLSACDFYGGALTHTSSHLIKYIGCHVDPDNYYFDGSWVQFSACTFPQGNSNTIHNDYNGHTSTTRWESDNVDLTGAFPAFIKSGYDSASSGTSPTIQYAHGGYISATGQVQAGITGSQFKAVIGSDVGAETSAACLWLLAQATALSSTNFAVQSDGSHVIVNCPQNSFVYLYEGGANELAGFSLAANTIGYSDSRAVNTVLGSMTTTYRSTGTGLTIDSGGVQDKQVWMTASCTITLPAPAVGRELEIVVAYDPTASAGTIARHASENINGAAANLTLGATDKWSILFVRCDGTNWVISKAAIAP